MQAIPGGIKALVILISSEMPDEGTDQNTTQPTYFFLLMKLYYLQTVKNTNYVCKTRGKTSSLIGSQNTRTDSIVLSKGLTQHSYKLCSSFLKGS